MSNKIKTIIETLKRDTNNEPDIVYRKKIINKETIYIVYVETLTSSDKISDFIIRSLDSIDYKYDNNKNPKKITNSEYEKIRNQADKNDMGDHLLP